MVEAAFGIVVVLALCFALLVGTLLIRAKLELNTAVDRGVRLGFTRGSLERSAADLIPALDDWRAGSADIVPPALLPLITTETNAVPRGVQHLNSWSVPNFGRPVNRLPREWLFALIYAQQHFRNALGASVKFPCEADPNTGYGCLDCHLSLPPEVVVGAVGELSPTPVILECAFVPFDFLIRPLLNLLAIYSGPGGNPIRLRSSQAVFGY